VGGPNFEGSRILSYTVNREYGCVFKRGAEKGARGVGEVVFAEKNFSGRDA